MSESHRQVSLPAEQFYWAIIDASVLGRRRAPSHEQLGFLFESYLPGLTIEDVQTVFHACDNSSQHYVACGLEKSTLRESSDESLLRLIPQDIPEHIATVTYGSDQEVSDFNVLTGDFTPPPLLRLNRRIVWMASVVLTLLLTLIALGYQRRAIRSVTQVQSIRTRIETLIDEVVPSTTDHLPAELRLAAELRRLEQTRGDDLDAPQRSDCVGALASLLSHWPAEDLHVSADSLAITPDSIQIRAQVPTMVDAQAFADAIGAIPAWSLHQPRSETSRDQVQVTARLERRKGIDS